MTKSLIHSTLGNDLSISLTNIQVSKNLLTAYSNLLSSDHRVLVFNNHTMQLGSGMQTSFQVLPAASVLNGVTSIVFSNFHFTSSKPTNRYCDQINRAFLSANN